MLIDYLPTFLSEIEEFQAILSSCQDTIDTINCLPYNILSNLFISETDLFNIVRYEKIVGIIAKFTQDLESRRTNVLLQYNYCLPFTLENLILMIDSICGQKNYSIKINYDNFLLSVKLNIEYEYLKGLLCDFLDRVVPLNMLLDIDLDYNLWREIHLKTWNRLIQFDWKGIKQNTQFKY